MEKLTWLQSLQKAEMPPTPLPEPAAKIDMFADLFKVDSDVAAEKASKVYDDGAADTSDPVSVLLKTEQDRKFQIPKMAAESLHKDGTFFEECGGITFRFTYKDGQLVKSESRNAAGRWEVISEHAAPKETFVTADIAKILDLAAISEEMPLAK
jgi:hypothetical protein